MHKTLVVLNNRAGTLLDRNPMEVKASLQRHFGSRGRTVDVVLTHGRGLCRAINRGTTSDYDTLIVGGGDGSVGYAAQRVAASGQVLGVLPLGTMNLLARDLGIPADLDRALDALDDATPQMIDLGVLNNRMFHTLSGVGFFSQMARAREEMRDLPGRVLRVAAAAVRALYRAGRLTLEITIDGKAQQSDVVSVLVTVNCFTGQAWRRERLDAGTLEVHIAHETNALGKLKAGADLLTGGWRDNPAIESFRAQRVVIKSGRRRSWVTTDGELVREHVPLVYDIQRRGLKVLVPSLAA